MKYRVRHVTTYQYGEPVLLCQNEVRLTPRNVPRQICTESLLEIRPEPDARSERIDYFGNQAVFFTVQERHQKLEVRTQSLVEVESYSPPMPGLTPPWEDVRDSLFGAEARQHLEAVEFSNESHYVKKDPRIAAYALESFTPRRPILDAALDLTRRIYTDFKYDSAATTLHTSVQEVFEMRRGVCQDFAHLQLCCLRSIGLAGRYISGYLLTAPPPGKERLIGTDASHAWISIYCGGFGWIDLDPTNNLVPSDKHVWLAWGRDYADVSPIKGVILGGGQHTIQVHVDVLPVADSV